MASLIALPVELLYEIHLFSGSTSLPCVNSRCHEIFKSTPPSFRAAYLLQQFAALQTTSSKARGFLTRALRFPLCNEAVLEAIFRSPACPPLDGTPELPKRLFKPLTPRTTRGKTGRDGDGFSAQDHPLPFLRYLYNSERIAHPDSNSHDGYALTRAVHARFIPLIRFLLDHGASPKCKDGLAVKVAIRKKDIALVRILIERDPFDPASRRHGSSKRRRKEDRMMVSVELLKEAVMTDAREIVTYFMREKGVVPDMRTLSAIGASGFYGDDLG